MPAWQGLWTHEASNPAGHSLQIDKNPNRYKAKRFANTEAARKDSALMNGLIGAATGSNVTSTRKRVSNADSGFGNGGGVRTIDTVTDINRNTAAADVTRLKEYATVSRTRPAYPRDLSGNGGPAFA